MTTPTQKLSDAGVSIWLDDLSRQRLTSGNLQELIDTKNVVGVTTNPTIFAAALADGESYREQVAELAAAGTSVDDAVFRITTDDVRDACDLFAPIAEGISVNVTLIFSLERYRNVINAYMEGLEKALENGKDLSTIHSVASFFVSRVDTEIDKRLDAVGSSEAAALKGKAGLANARLAYQVYEQSLDTERWKRLAAAGANPQRPLWASTGVKDPELPDTLYVTELVAPNTVNTMPEKTLDATFDHAEVTADTVTATYEESSRILDEIGALGVSYQEVVEQLETEGLQKFDASWDELLATVRTALDDAR